MKITKSEEFYLLAYFAYLSIGKIVPAIKYLKVYFNPPIPYYQQLTDWLLMVSNGNQEQAMNKLYIWIK